MTSVLDNKIRMRAELCDVKRQNATLDFIRSALDPSRYNTPPPSVDMRGDFVKDGTIILNAIIPTGAQINEMVPANTGMLLWLVDNGLFSCYREHFVIPGTVSTVGSGTNSQNQGLIGPQLDLAPCVKSPDRYGIIASLTYVSQLALPVSSNYSATDQVSVSVSNLSQLSYTRMFSGVLTAVSASTSIGNTALTGTFAAISIEDTRGISQDAQGNAFSVATTTQASETSKDYVMQVPSDVGVAVVIGDDVPLKFTNPQQDQSVIADGQCAVYNTALQPYNVSEVDFNTTNCGPSGGPWGVVPPGPEGWPPPSFIGGWSVQFFAYFVTPWNITAQTRATSSGVVNIQTFPIGETEVLKIKIVVPASQVQNNCGTQTATDSVIMAIATHIFATCDTAGTIWYSCFTEQKPLQMGGTYQQYMDGVKEVPQNAQTYDATPPFFTARTTGNQSGGAYQGYGHTAEFNPIEFRQSFTTQGKYLGSYIAIAGGPSAQTFPYSDDDNDQGYWFAVGPATFYVTCSGINVPGRVGPARIIRWDNLSSGMQLAVSGKFWVQAVPSALLAPYVKAAIMGKNRACSDSALQLLAALCSGQGQIKRVWTLKEYNRYINEDLPKLDLAVLTRMAENDDNLVSAMIDANLFQAMRRARLD